VPAVCVAEAIEDSLIVRNGRYLRMLGGGLVVVSTVTGYFERLQHGEGRVEAGVREGLEVAGGLAGTKVGIDAGLLCGPGAAVCSGVGGLVGGLVGAWLGDRLGDFLFSDVLAEAVDRYAMVDLPTVPFVGL
jgi:phage tail tape-measure protein